MLNKLIKLLAVLTLLNLAGCGEQNKASMLDDISGVWKASSANDLITFQYANKKMLMLQGDVFIPVTVGDMDEQNQTVNLNVQLNDGTTGVWTVREIWDKEKTNFHLAITFNDGGQDELSFVRTISTDDLKRIAGLTRKPVPNAPAEPVKEIATPEPAAPPAVEVPPVVEAPQPQTTVQENIAVEDKFAFLSKYAVSFDCAKAGNYAEQTVCSNATLGQLDGLLQSTYQSRSSPEFRPERWMMRDKQKTSLNKRNACTDAVCITQTYKDRIGELCDIQPVSGVHADSDCDQIPQ